MNAITFKVGRGPDFAMTFGQIEIMHRISLRISDETAGTSQPILISNRSFHQCQIELLRLLKTRADTSGWRIVHLDKESGSCRLKINSSLSTITPIFPEILLARHRVKLAEIFVNNLRYSEKIQKHSTMSFKALRSWLR
ncbi:MAG: hypothetical protein NT027_13445 [Proteobacteria bacterium]|nr:hypothetical protein [Pseudomonadota bacterium]